MLQNLILVNTSRMLARCFPRRIPLEVGVGVVVGEEGAGVVASWKPPQQQD